MTNITIDDNTKDVTGQAITATEKLSNKITDALTGGGNNFIALIGQTQRVARAHRTRALMTAQTQKDVVAIEHGEKWFDGAQLHETRDVSVESERALRLLDQEILTKEYRRKQRLASILDKASEQAEQVEYVDDQPLDPDWFCEWVATAENIHKESLQDVWAKILVKESAKPGTYSPRVFDFLKYLTPNEAALIEKMAKLVLDNKILKPTQTTLGMGLKLGEIPERFICTDDLIKLSALGLLIFENAMHYRQKSYSNSEEFLYIFSGTTKGLVVGHSDKQHILEVASVPLTPLGANVVSILDHVPTCDEYLQVVGEALVIGGYTAKICDLSKPDSKGARNATNVSDIRLDEPTGEPSA